VRAVTFTGAGGNEVVAVQERADPVSGTDEVLVAARFAGHLERPGKTGKILLDFG
jgi:NADPH:quinone reductase-like Zn-dependent oxidoreductase